METQVTNGAGKKSKKSGAAVGRRNSMYDIVVDRLDAVLLREAAKEASLAFGEEDSSEQVAVNLQALYKRQQAEKKTPLFQCEVEAGGCGADQPRIEGACPFCGFDPDAPQEVAESKDGGAKFAEDDLPVAEKEALQEPGAFTEGANPEPATDITDPELVLAADTTPVEPRRGRGRPKGAKNLPKGREDVPGEMPPAGASTGLAKVVPSSMMVRDDTTPASLVQTSRDLDEAILAFRKATSATFLAWREEGLALWEIFSKDMWKLRLDPATKAPKYKSFQQFVSDEIKLTPNYVFDRMDAARAYPEEEAARLGMVNCVLLLKAPEEERKKIEQRIHRGEIKSNAETRKEVAKANAGKPEKSKGTKSGERAKGAGRKREYVKLAIAEQLGKSTIGMLSDPGDGSKATKITEVPVAVEKWLTKMMPFAQHESLDGEVVETFGLLVKDGKLSLVIHRSRPADDAE
jgi:hypothetical protein